MPVLTAPLSLIWPKTAYVYATATYKPTSLPLTKKSLQALLARNLYTAIFIRFSSMSHIFDTIWLIFPNLTQIFIFNLTHHFWFESILMIQFFSSLLIQFDSFFNLIQSWIKTFVLWFQIQLSFSIPIWLIFSNTI